MLLAMKRFCEPMMKEFYRLQLFLWEENRRDLKQVALMAAIRGDGGFVHVALTSLKLD